MKWKKRFTQTSWFVIYSSFSVTSRLGGLASG